MKTQSIRHAGFESTNLRRVANATILVSLLMLAENRAAQTPPSPLPSSAEVLKQIPAPDSQWDGKFSGHPLTLDLVDLPLVDFFRLMAEEGGINVVIDPEIKGSISIKVVKLPWDQIFEAVLLNNGLDKHIEGNLVRIATKLTLQEEAKQREALKKANRLAADLATRIKRMNHANAADSAPAPFGPARSDQTTVR